ncbi:TrmH family RNA methyltransferase [Fodinicola feengrottensis]|uniref:RNA methyltransferase n=1 Tax=Fodinicola feengrottensis TaxID=435914 RepID=A0ABN2IWU5_9ACTN|nr:RNA methyltransferase [Fodinicola feengrottensis]
MAFETLTDPDDPRLADYRCLTDVDLRTAFEPPHGLFIAEGELVLRRAVRAGYQLRSILVDSKRTDAVADLGAVTGAPVYAADQQVLQATTGFHVHRGLLASVHRRPLPAVADLLATAGRIAVMEDVNNHTNIGAIFRCAAALDINAVLLSPSCADPLYRRSVRVSMGEVFAIPYARLDDWPGGLKVVRDAGFRVLAMTLAPDAVDLDKLSADDRRRPALLLGAEGPGLTAAAVANADVAVKIPMSGGVDSLNVAAAAAVAFWEISRDR